MKLMKLFEHENDTWDEPQYTTVRHSWKVLQLGRFTLLEVYYSRDGYDQGWQSVTLLLHLLKSGALFGLDVQTQVQALGMYWFNWSDQEWEL
jgi:hypothetical protein